MLVYLLTFYCRCTIPGSAIFFIAHSLLNCHSSFCYHAIHCFVIYAHFSSLKQLNGFTCACLFIDILLSLYYSRNRKLEPRPCIVTRVTFVYNPKNYIQQHEPRGARFKRLFQPNQPSMETTMQNYYYPDKHVPY